MQNDVNSLDCVCVTRLNVVIVFMWWFYIRKNKPDNEHCKIFIISY